MLRDPSYVAMTRGRHATTAYVYADRWGGDHEHAEEPGLHVLRRGTHQDAAALVRGIIATHDERAYTAHQVAADTDAEQLPDRVASLLERRTKAVQARRTAYGHWHQEVTERIAVRQRWIEQHLHRSGEQTKACWHCGVDARYWS
ncbi:MAG: hypothetical protein ACLP3C_01335 [Mycobacterium sp.]|uniref:hypothetical protein n=1 Tax=Mycobacterium sp. TaxID=1785 RepID=UPI003F9ABCEC